jgi:hypothetical protein
MSREIVPATREYPTTSLLLASDVTSVWSPRAKAGAVHADLRQGILPTHSAHQFVATEKEMISTRSHMAHMRARPVLAAVVLVLGACHPVQVRTVVAPGADFSNRKTFHLMTPKPRVNAQRSESDPVLVNSITYQRMRQAVQADLEQKGYSYTDQGQSMSIAIYASAKDKLDVRTWDYGYGWRRWPRERTEVYQYTQGTVIIDVVDPASKELLWRGQGRAEVSDDPTKYSEELDKASNKILAKFPNAAS